MHSISDILNDYSNFVPIQGKPGRSCFEAIQNGTNRTVILEVLNRQEQSAEISERFLEEAKTRACADCPHVCSVLEAGERDGILFLSREKPSGSSIRELKDAGKSFSSSELFRILVVTSGALADFEQKAINTTPADIEDIYMGEGGIFLINPAIPGQRNPNATEEDMKTLGTQLSPLIPTGTPGATRLATIFKIMREGHMGIAVDWKQIGEMAQTVLDQLEENKGTSTRIVVPTPSRHSLKWGKSAIRILIGVLILSSITAGIFLNMEEKKPPLPPKHKVPAFLNRDHTTIAIPSGLPQGTIPIDAHEVTIGTYARFLDSLNNMPDSGKKKFDDPDQPREKNNHIPDDWDNMLKAAKTNTLWQGKTLSMRSPVVNVDFWDATAYANWKDHRLPTREEWMTIAGKLKLNGKGDPPCPVDRYDQDVDASGLCGFASGVREWTSSIERDISRPVDPPKRVSCGGTSSSPGLDQIHYEPSSEERSPDLGFRTIRN